MVTQSLIVGIGLQIFSIHLIRSMIGNSPFGGGILGYLWVLGVLSLTGSEITSLANLAMISISFSGSMSG